jgi:glycosyltransferase involved in cell wall biosynthesis
MKKLSEEHPEIKLFYHEKNKGGGAARNTAVENSHADVIFCLDSDDILPPNILPNMLAYLHEKKCDGVTFSGSYSFKKDFRRNKKIDFNLPPNKPLTLDYLFQGKSGVGINFMYTKRAFETVGGYPTDHGFDTQAYSFKFMCNGLTTYPCPETFLFQRQFGDNVSYFERSYTSGEFSVGHYLMFREYLEIFSKKAQELILNYDIFFNNSFEKNIFVDLQELYRSGPEDFFQNEDALMVACQTDSEHAYQKKDFRKSIPLISKINKPYRNIYFDLIRYIYGVNNQKVMSIEEYKATIKVNLIIPHVENQFRLSIYKRIKRKIKKILAK